MTQRLPSTPTANETDTNPPTPRVVELEAQVTELRRQLRYANERNHERNLQLDSLNFVWCDGGCPNGTRRWQDDELTADQAEAYAKELALMAVRLETWGATKRYRQRNRWLSAHAHRMDDETLRVSCPSNPCPACEAFPNGWQGWCARCGRAHDGQGAICGACELVDASTREGDQ